MEAGEEIKSSHSARATTADAGWRNVQAGSGVTKADRGWRDAQNSSRATTADQGWRSGQTGLGKEDMDVMRQTRANPYLTIDQFRAAASKLQILKSRDGKSYKVKSTLSKKGGEGAVLLCSDEQGNDVAVKIYYTPLEGNGHSVEARLQVLNYMRTPEGLEYTLEVKDIGNVEIENGIYYFEVSPRCEQSGLIDWPHTVAELKPIVRRLNEALHNIHQHGILHRDLKEENLFLQNGKIVIGDFGVAKLANSGATATTTGTMGYTAPEALMAISAKDITFFFDERCDYYSLGITLAGLYEGHFVWDGLDAKAMTLRIKQSDIPLSRPDPEREQLENLLTGLCQFDANLRFGYEEVQKWLENPNYTIHLNTEEVWPRAFEFMGNKYRDERRLFEAISATPESWQEGLELFYAGYLANFFKQIGDTLGMKAERLVEQWRNLNRDKGLAMFLKEMYRPGPLVWKGYTFGSLQELAAHMKDSKRPAGYGEMLQLFLVSDWLRDTSGLTVSNQTIKLVTDIEAAAADYPEEACYWFGFAFSIDKGYPVYANARANDYGSLLNILFSDTNVSRFYHETYPKLMDRTAGAKFYGYLRYMGYGAIVKRIWDNMDNCSEFDRFTSLLDSMDAIAVKERADPSSLRRFFVESGPLSIPMYVCTLEKRHCYKALSPEYQHTLKRLETNSVMDDLKNQKTISEIYRNAQPLMETMDQLEAALTDNPFVISAGAYKERGIICVNLAAVFGYRFLGRKAPLGLESIIEKGVHER